ncbi:porin family protein [Paraflavitalea sp. CAU 1676]|uniref:porin family protein n=1 Tax=Paraflavitalea sp. CAU 1676 TaxID=3032598 RepID=UPI0023DB7F8C|nr:porin family protein [Paraflavitalea sp. CAU 1676]MDF2189966.1 porin family protein [Paraflavitalea sp. CAU 1676]
MYPLNDNDLDRLSREAAEQYDVESSTSGWEALETQLNRELPLKEDKERRRFLFWLFLIVLLAGGGVMYTMTGNKTDRTLQVTGPNTVPTAKDRTSDNKGSIPTTQNTIPTQEAEATSSAGEIPSTATSTDPVTAGKAATDPTVLTTTDKTQKKTLTGTPQAETTDNTASTTVDRPNTGHTTPGDRAFQKNGPGNRKHIVGTSAAGLRSNTSTVQPGNENLVGQSSRSPLAPGITSSSIVTENDLHASLVNQPRFTAGTVGPIKAPPLTLAVNSQEKEPAKIQRKREPRGFELGLLAGPDMSNVKFTNTDKLGYNVGLQVGYRFNNRWSVNTGFMYTRKNYTVEGEDFTKPNYGWWRWIDLTKVKGYCEMFEVPLNVRYDFSVNRKTRWYATAGASSYFMTGEEYTYDYLYNGVPGTAPRSYDSSSNYIFSILNLGVGFERSVGERLSIQAEPYFKLPTKGLGYGKINLNSYGIYFGVKYKLHK